LAIVRPWRGSRCTTSSGYNLTVESPEKATEPSITAIPAGSIRQILSTSKNTACMTVPRPVSRRNGLGGQSGDYLFGLPNQRSLSTFCSALTTAATFRMRWVVIAASDSRRDARKGDTEGGLLSVRSGWCSRKFPIRYASRHSGQRLSAKHSILPHNVVRYRGGRSILVIEERNICTIRLFVSAWDVLLGGSFRCVS
jgi:hypothetical protein